MNAEDCLNFSSAITGILSIEQPRVRQLIRCPTKLEVVDVLATVERLDFLKKPNGTDRINYGKHEDAVSK